MEENFETHLPSLDQIGGTAETAVFAIGTHSHSWSLPLVSAAAFLRCCLSAFLAARRCSTSRASCGAEDGPAAEEACEMGLVPFSFRFLSLLLGFDGPGSAIEMSMVRHESEVKRGKSGREGEIFWRDAVDIQTGHRNKFSDVTHAFNEFRHCLTTRLLNFSTSLHLAVSLYTSIHHARLRSSHHPRQCGRHLGPEHFDPSVAIQRVSLFVHLLVASY